MPLVLLVMVLAAIVFTSLGMAIASRMDDMHAFPLVMNFLVMPLFFLSGALFPLEGLPSAMDAVIKANPMSYAVDGLRLSLTGIGQFGYLADLGVLAIAGALLVLIGTVLFRRIEA
jgi:ABC-2 type transport system permease protein